MALVSPGDLLEIARLRSEFDGIGIRESIRNGDDQWEGRILAAFHALKKRSKMSSDGEIDREWEVVHVQFHRELVSECRMPKLLQLRNIFEMQARRYRRISVHYLRAPRDDLSEHQRLMDAVLDRNPEAATERIREHYMRTVDIILSGEAANDPGAS